MKFNFFGTKINVSFLFLAIITFMFLIDKSGILMPMSIAVILHEISHLIAMGIFRCQPKEIRLIPGGIEITRSFCLKKKTEILISLSGPFINIFLFVVFLKIDIEFSLINLCIGVFNLLPLSFLDGGEILIKLLGEYKAEKIFKLLSILIGGLGVFLGVYLIINKIPNISLLIFSVYLILSIIIKF